MNINGVEFDYSKMNDRHYKEAYINEVTNRGLRIMGKTQEFNKCFKCEKEDKKTEILYIENDVKYYICNECEEKYNYVTCNVCDYKMFNTPDFVSNHRKSNEHKKNIYGTVRILQKINSIDTDTDDETPTDESESDDEEENRERFYNIHGDLYKRVKLWTFNKSYKEHTEAINKFNRVFDTNERGARKIGTRYETEGETNYNLTGKPKLYDLLNNDIEEVEGVFIQFLKPKNPPTHPDYNLLPIPMGKLNEYEQDLKNALDDEVVYNITIRKVYDYLINLDFIKSRMSYTIKTMNINKNPDLYNVGNVIYERDDKHNKISSFYEIVKTTQHTIKCKVLKPELVIKYNNFLNNERPPIYKYSLGKYNENMKDRTFKKNSFNSYYIVNRYFYHMVY